MSKSHRVVPIGDECFRFDAVLPGDPVTHDARGRLLDLPTLERTRENVCAGALRKRVMCPYWQPTRHGTVRCELTNHEEWTTSSEYAVAFEDLDFDGAHELFPAPGSLQKQIKVCGHNTLDAVYGCAPGPDGRGGRPIDAYLEREVLEPPGPVLTDAWVGRFVWHRELGFGVVSDVRDAPRGLGRAAFVLFCSEIGEQTVLLSSGLLHDDPLPAGAAATAPDDGDALRAALASIPGRLAALAASGARMGRLPWQPGDRFWTPEQGTHTIRRIRQRAGRSDALAELSWLPTRCRWVVLQRRCQRMAAAEPVRPPLGCLASVEVGQLVLHSALGRGVVRALGRTDHGWRIATVEFEADGQTHEVVVGGPDLRPCPPM